LLRQRGYHAGYEHTDARHHEQQQRVTHHAARWWCNSRGQCRSATSPYRHDHTDEEGKKKKEKKEKKETKKVTQEQDDVYLGCECGCERGYCFSNTKKKTLEKESGKKNKLNKKTAKKTQSVVMEMIP
jgi:hypothetical protein